MTLRLHRLFAETANFRREIGVGHKSVFHRILLQVHVTTPMEHHGRQQQFTIFTMSKLVQAKLFQSVEKFRRDPKQQAATYMIRLRILYVVTRT